MEASHRFDLVTTSCVNKEVVTFNRRLQKIIKSFNHAEIVNMRSFSNKIMQIFTTCKPKPPLFLTWKAETSEEDREVRKVEEGIYSPSQESGLNRQLAGNNNRCKIISVSDSVTSTGGKESESESEGDELNYKTSKRTKKDTRSRYGDFLWT